jgi:hypothetical protein
MKEIHVYFIKSIPIKKLYFTFKIKKDKIIMEQKRDKALEQI